MSMKIVIVTGSRDLLNKELVFGLLNEEMPDLVVHGGCSGADYWAHLWCAQAGCDERIYRARWKLDGRRAGPMRNQRMVESYEGTGAKVLAFPKGASPGTRDCMRRAKKMGLSLAVFEHE